MIEFQKGDKIVATWGVGNRVFEICLKPKFKSRALYLTINVDGVRREVLAQWYQHATAEEIARGFKDD